MTYFLDVLKQPEMMTSNLPDIKKTQNMKLRRLILSFAFGVLSFSASIAVIPSWVAGTPSIPTIGPLSFTCNYGINITGKVYIAVLGNYSTTDFAGSTIR